MYFLYMCITTAAVPAVVRHYWDVSKFPLDIGISMPFLTKGGYENIAFFIYVFVHKRIFRTTLYFL